VNRHQDHLLRDLREIAIRRIDGSENAPVSVVATPIRSRLDKSDRRILLADRSRIFEKSLGQRAEDEEKENARGNVARKDREEGERERER